jgi:hypothetical protein
MFMETAKALSISEQVNLDLRTIATMIVSNEHLRLFLLKTPIDKRREAYDALKPHLKFQAKAYFWLMRKRNQG